MQVTAQAAAQSVETKAHGVKSFVRGLDLQRFRSYCELSLELDERPVVLTGPNGAGKTNLLEAVSVLSPGRGLRSAELRSMAQGGGQGLVEAAPYLWAVSAVVGSAGRDIRIGTGAEVTAQGVCRRVTRIDGETADGPSALGQHLRLMWLTPAMDRLFVEGKSARRRFLDRMVLAHDPDHATRATAYERAMRERQRLLKDGINDETWLGVLEETMAEQGVAIAAARLTTLLGLRGALEKRASSPFPLALIALEGELEQGLEEASALDVEDAFMEALAKGRRRDTEAGRALQGPHRSDLLVTHAAKNLPANLCSTGEQKALLIAIFLANAWLLKEDPRDISPILLLDEISAHLDAKRRAGLFEELCALSCQSWLTGTDQSLFVSLADRAQMFQVADGQVWPQ